MKIGDQGAAKESPQILKQRRKLEKQMAAERAKMTPEAVSKMTSLIQNWLHRHDPERITLKNRDIALFDANKHPEPSHNMHVTHLTATLSHLMTPEKDDTTTTS